MELNATDFLQRISNSTKAINGALDSGYTQRQPSNVDYGWDDPALGMAGVNTMSQPQDIHEKLTISPERFAMSKMAEDIKQSMLNEVIDTSALERTDADRMAEKLGQDKLERIKSLGGASKRKTAAAPSSTTPQTGIDYGLIRDIINGCIENKLKEMLSELSIIALKGGRIQLVDNKGNIYDAKLEKRK